MIHALSRPRAVGWAALAVFVASVPAAAFEPMKGCFVADAACAAVSSIRKNSNPGDVQTSAGTAYDLLGGNAHDPSHLRIRMPGAHPLDRWVPVDCGHVVVPCDDFAGRLPAIGPAATEPPSYVLAVTWQPAFCETHRSKPECRTQTPDRFDAAHFTLHGLWPEPRDNVYCGVGAHDEILDMAGRWDELPALDLSQEVRRELDRVMPGTRSGLHRHEWIKHGTCYGADADEYFAESLQLVDELNTSAVRALFAGRTGDGISRTALRVAFDDAFGPGAGDRVSMVCRDRLVTELRINLEGEITEATTLADLLAAASPANPGCSRGIVDAAGYGP